MKKIPIYRTDYGLCLKAQINRFFNIEFALDTGCSSTVISKEAADLLYLRGYLSDKTYEGSFYTGIFNPKNSDDSYVITIQGYMSTLSANSFRADVKINRQVTAQGVTLTKAK